VPCSVVAIARIVWTLTSGKRGADKPAVKRITASILALVFAGTALAGPPPDLAALTRIASKLSGLPAKRKVSVQVVSGAALEKHALALLDRDYPRDRQAYDQTVYRALGLLPADGTLRPVLVRRHVRGVRGLYDPHRRTAYVRRGASRRDVTLTVLVQALEDQAFDLRRLSGLRRGNRDAALGAAAAVEGAAAYAHVGTSITLGAGASTPGDAFVELEAEFRRATGAGLAARLDYLGGRKAVWSALRRFPETTEQVFHVDAFLARELPRPLLLPESAAGFDLARHDTWGELDVRALLAVFQVPRVDVVGAGWGGGASAVYRGAAGEAVALLLEWDSDEDADEWAEAVETYVNEAFAAAMPGRPATTPCVATFCWSLTDRSIAFTRLGTMTSLVVGSSVGPAAELAVALR
jgi:hypothetical protein